MPFMGIIDISLRKRRHGCNTVELDDGWKFLYYGAEKESLPKLD